MQKSKFMKMDLVTNQLINLGTDTLNFCILFLMDLTLYLVRLNLFLSHVISQMQCIDLLCYFRSR